MAADWLEGVLEQIAFSWNRMTVQSDRDPI
jgi:hypothetical protein